MAARAAAGGLCSTRTHCCTPAADPLPPLHPQWQRKQQQQPGAAAAEDDDSAAAAKSLRGEIQLLRQRRLLRTLSLVQDAADLLMLLPDLRPLGPGRKRGLLYHPATLSLCGLVSGLLSGYKNWPGGRKA